MKCHKCHHKNPPNANFCEKCGVSLGTQKHIKKEETTSQIDTDAKNKKASSPINALQLVGVLFLLSLAILLPTKIVSYQESVPYTTTEKYDVQVPYEDIEASIVKIPYETTETYVESVPVQQEEPYTAIDCLALGLFCKEVTKYRNVTIYKDVIKERTVTKYRDETQYTKVTKMRTETRERDVGGIKTETKYKEVNWLFGFDAIIKFRKL